MHAPWKKSYDKPSRDITLRTKLCIVKTMVFSVVMCGCESWMTKKAEHPRIDAFKLWCWRKLLRVPWTAWRSNQSILKEISPEYSLEGLMLKLATWCEELTQWKRLMLGKIEGRKRRRRQRMRWLDGNINSMEMSVSKLQETVKDREAWRAAGHRVAKSQTWLSDWTSKILNEMELLNYCLIHLTDVKCLSHMTDTQNLITIMLHERSQTPQKSTHTSYKVPSYKILENTK